MRSAAIALLLAAVGLAVWSWWSRTDSVPAPAVAARGSAGTSTGATMRSSGAAESGRALVPPPAVPPVSTDTVPVDVRVIDWVSGAPVAGADVWWMHAAAWDRVNALTDVERARYRDDQELTTRTFGRHARTDGRGVVRVHVESSRTTVDVLARCAGRAGWVRVPMPESERGATIEISRELAVTARVVDPAGRPVPGVPVEWRRVTSAIGPRESDASGAVRFEYAQSYLGRGYDGAPRTCHAELQVCVPGLGECALSFLASSPPAETLTLVLPPTGTLHVHVSHPGREIESAGARLWIGAVDDRNARNESWQRAADADGVIRYRVVPLVGAFVVELEIGDLRLPRTVAGPTRAGELTEATVEVPADAVALVGRMLDVDRRPLASTSVWLRCNLPREDGRYWLHTDERGRFLWHPGATGAGDRELSDFLVFVRRETFDDDIAGMVRRRVLQPGINDLGDIRLTRWPLVVAGRFEPPESQNAVPFTIERWVEGAEPGSAGRWQAVGDEGLTFSRHEGRFVVRGTPPPGRLRVSCGAGAAPVEFVPGADDLIIETVK